MVKSRYCWIALAIFIIGAMFFKFAYRPQSQIIVAIVDTGLDLKQTRFVFSSTQGFNVLESGKPPQDDNGHGTQIASVINFLEPRIRIMPIKAIQRSGISTKQELARGIVAAVERGAKIINISAGVISSSPDLENAVRYAEKKNVIIIAAAGDSGMGIEYPAAYPTVLAIGAVDYNGEKLLNSNTGPELDAVALGEYSTIGLREECRIGAGTSLAVPLVSIYTARILLNKPNFKSEEIRNILLNSAKDIDKSGKDDKTGYGLLEQKKNISICSNKNYIQ